jgi:hypothetical protein
MIMRGIINNQFKREYSLSLFPKKRRNYRMLTVNVIKKKINLT